jgi:hypothetical protein
MALKIGNVTVANDRPNVSWTLVSNLPSNLVSNIRIQGTGTTTLQVNTSIEGIIIFTKT